MPTTMEALFDGVWRPFAITEVDILGAERTLDVTLEELRAKGPKARGRIQAGACNGRPWYVYQTVDLARVREA